MPKYGDKRHVRGGIKLAKPLLKECGYAREEIKKIVDTMSKHSTS